MKILLDENVPIRLKRDFQQNVKKLSFVIVVLTVVINKYQNLLPLIKPLHSVLENPPLDKLIVIKKENG